MQNYTADKIGGRNEVGLIWADAASWLGCLHSFIGAKQEAEQGTNVQGHDFDLWRSEDPNMPSKHLSLIFLPFLSKTLDGKAQTVFKQQKSLSSSPSVPFRSLIQLKNCGTVGIDRDVQDGISLWIKKKQILRNLSLTILTPQLKSAKTPPFSAVWPLSLIISVLIATVSDNI